MDHRYKVGGYVKLAKLWERSKDAAVAYHSSYYAEKFKTDSDKKLVDLPMRVDIVTDDDDQRIDTILDVDNQRQSLKDLAEKYTSIRRKDYLEWKIRLEHEMTKAEKNERGRTV